MWQPQRYTPPPEYRAADVQTRFAAGEVELLDVREPEEWDAGHIAGAHWIPLGALQRRVGELDAGKAWVCVCHVGQRSAMAADFLRAQGFDAANLRGGMDAWARAGLPEERGRGTPKP